MALLLDTHAIIWYLSNSPELSVNAKQAIERAERLAEEVVVSAITLVEIIYLTERGRLPQAAMQRLEQVLNDPSRRLADWAGEGPRHARPDHCCDGITSESRSRNTRPPAPERRGENHLVGAGAARSYATVVVSCFSFSAW